MNTPAVEVSELRRRLQAALAACGEHGVPYPQQLEADFPRILQRIVELWRTPELDYYFEGLLTTYRHDRQGFPEAIALELFHLANLHSTLHLSTLTRKSPWDWAEEHDLLKKPEA